MNFAEVVILRNHMKIDQGFTYRIPETIGRQLTAGDRVMVPFGAQGEIEGVIIEVHHRQPKAIDNIKEITFAFDRSLSLPSELISLAETMRSLYLCTYMEALQLMLPTGVLVESIPVYYRNGDLEFDTQSLKPSEKCVYESITATGTYKTDMHITYSDVALNKALKRLLALDVIYEKTKYVQQVKDRYITYYEVVENIADLYGTIPERFKMRKNVCRHLMQSPCGTIQSLRENTKAPKSVVDWYVKKGLITLSEVEEKRIPEFMQSNTAKAYTALTPVQQTAYEDILKHFEQKCNIPVLLHGVTGSGKTEVYAALIEHCLNAGKKAILMVPEISLTPQIVSRFAKRFGKEHIALVHSKLSYGEKYDQWRAMQSGEIDIVIGARSAIFAPVSNIGIIILDESHEQSYRSDRRPKYDTYQLALLRAADCNALVLTGSATPSVEHVYESYFDKCYYVPLNDRFNNSPPPDPEIIDMREELSSGNRSILSKRLFSAIEERLNKNEQTIIFLNRTGHSTFVSCRSCGYTLACPNCDITLTYHKHDRSMKCHYCQYESFVPKKCPECGSHYFKHFGVGTEKLEETLQSYFPDATIGRMDRTTTRKKGSFESLIKKVEDEAIDILVGTQMVAKGLDFEKVTLVGIISVDLLMNMPHFQAGERTYQLVNQVAGRAGRGKWQGEVILQTYQPDHYAITSPNYMAFYQKEIIYREKMHYPPFVKMVNFIFQSRDESVAKLYAEKSCQYIKRNLLKKGLQNQVEIYPAHPALLKKIDNAYRYQVLLKVKPSHMDVVRYYALKLQTRFVTINDCKINIDLDARNIL